MTDQTNSGISLGQPLIGIVTAFGQVTNQANLVTSLGLIPMKGLGHGQFDITPLGLCLSG